TRRTAARSETREGIARTRRTGGPRPPAPTWPSVPASSSVHGRHPGRQVELLEGVGHDLAPEIGGAMEGGLDLGPAVGDQRFRSCHEIARSPFTAAASRSMRDVTTAPG